jgi:DNA end-binding protein Ku
MLISTMHYQDDIKGLPKNYSKPKVAKQELDMAKMLINSMDTPFDPSQYKDEYQDKLRGLIETKIAGKEVVAAKPEAAGKVINLMDALKASLEQAGSLPGEKPAGAKKTAGAKKAPEKEKVRA